MRDIDGLTQKLKATTGDVDGIVDLLIDALITLRSMVTDLEAIPARPAPSNGSARIDEVSWRKVAEAVRQLPGRKARLIAGYLNRDGRPCARTRNGNGHTHPNQLETGS
jgi:hypothetical protein